MGYYLPGPPKGKAQYLKDTYGAEEVRSPVLPVPPDKALICVVDNGPFEAAGYAFSEAEREAMTYAGDDRPKTWLLMDKATVHELTKFRG